MRDNLTPPVRRSLHESATISSSDAWAVVRPASSHLVELPDARTPERCGRLPRIGASSSRPAPRQAGHRSELAIAHSRNPDGDHPRLPCWYLPLESSHSHEG